MAAEVHQFGVDVCGHAAVERKGEVRAAGHHAGAARGGVFGPPLHQGTKSGQEENLHVPGSCLCDKMSAAKSSTWSLVCICACHTLTYSTEQVGERSICLLCRPHYFHPDAERRKSHSERTVGV